MKLIKPFTCWVSLAKELPIFKPTQYRKLKSDDVKT